MEAQKGNGADGAPQPVVSDQHTLSARQMVLVCLAIEKNITEFKQRAQRRSLTPNRAPLDPTGLILDAIAIQGRTLAFILDELLLARGEDRAIVFKPPDAEPAEVAGPRLVV